MSKLTLLLMLIFAPASSLHADISEIDGLDGLGVMISNIASGLSVTNSTEDVPYNNSWSPFAWNTTCSKDKFNGRKSCSLSKAHSNIMVSIFDGRHSVYIGQDHFPRSQSAIKIDNNTPVYGYEGSSNTPQKVIEQMKKGKVAYTRYKEWPYEYNQDGETDLTGFAEKYEEMLKEYQKL